MSDEVFAALGPGGRFVSTFRDLTRELEGLDRFIPVRSDRDTVFTCFLEYEPETVNVHDLVYSRNADGWDFARSCYRKLRLSESWVVDDLSRAGFSSVEGVADRVVVAVVGGSVAVFLVTMALIESIAERNLEMRDLLAKLIGAMLVMAAAAAARALTVSGSLLVVGLVLAGLVVYGVLLQQRLHLAGGPARPVR